ncbi:glycogen-binding subunit 76A-like [Ptychodera flava]|uniref:glycogen-binding subunit 76A-like n=1 Tax=Ptychodera flava TaxID=63121 RepID=UPI00396A6977
MNEENRDPRGLSLSGYHINGFGTQASSQYNSQSIDEPNSPPVFWSPGDFPPRECRSPDEFYLDRWANGYTSYSSGASSSGESSPLSPTRHRKPSGSSLKDPSKTPPGTPTRRKSVKFADALGLDLEFVRHILTDSVPNVPDYAYSSLVSQDRLGDHKYLTTCFTQPSALPDFMDRIRSQKVCLENAVVSGLTILGTVKVLNIAYHKTVKVRFTTTEWRTSYDIPASYVQDSCDGQTDRFSFGLTTPRDFHVGARLHFAVMYEVSGATHWDNNHGGNYTFECYTRANDSTGDGDALWMHFV